MPVKQCDHNAIPNKERNTESEKNTALIVSFYLNNFIISL